MARTIVWNKRAESDLDQIIEYLLYTWPEDVAKNYLIRVSYITSLVAKSPEIGVTSSSNNDIKTFLITKHSTLIYRVADDKITILNIFDNRQDPAKRKY